MGVDLPAIGLFVLLLLVFGQIIFWVTKKVLRKVLKASSEKKVKRLSRVSAFVFSPVIVIGSLTLFTYIVRQTAPRESDEEMVRNHYKMMEEDIRKDLKVGMTKTEIVGLFGDVDTTQFVLVYDLSLPGAKEKYILEVKFDLEGLKDFKRRR